MLPVSFTVLLVMQLQIKTGNGDELGGILTYSVKALDLLQQPKPNITTVINLGLSEGPDVSNLPLKLEVKEQRDSSKVQYEVEENVNSEEKPMKPKRKGKPKKKKKPKNPPPDSDEESQEEENDYEADYEEPAPSKSSSKKPKRPKSQPQMGPKGKIFFEETFSERSWDTAWIYSRMEYGDEKKKYEKFYRIRSRRGDKGFDYGLVTSNKGSEEYAISATFQPFNSNDAPILIQFSLQYQAPPHCEYAYLKIFDCKFKPEELTSDTPFLVQFGPNICSEEKQLSLVVSDAVKGEKYVVSENIEAVTSTNLHVYSFIIQPEGTYHVLINDKSVQNGTLTSIFPSYQGFSSVCAVGISIWHSILDKFFKGQIIIDDILIASDLSYGEKRRVEILNLFRDNANNYTKT